MCIAIYYAWKYVDHINYIINTQFCLNNNVRHKTVWSSKHNMQSHAPLLCFVMWTTILIGVPCTKTHRMRYFEIKNEIQYEVHQCKYVVHVMWHHHCCWCVSEYLSICMQHITNHIQEQSGYQNSNIIFQSWKPWYHPEFP